ncbi:MAG: HAD family hydrolase [Pirellulaceae bacterium]
MQIQAVIFDLDGTLLDSLADIANAANTILQSHGFPSHSIDAYRMFVGDGVGRLVHRVVPEAYQQDQTLLATLVREFVEEYRTTWNIESRLYDGIAELLDELVRREIRLAVLSNKPQAATERCVGHYLAQFGFAAVLGQQADRPPKPDPTGAHQIMAHLELPAEGCCYLGDTGVDMQTARGAGMLAVGVTWGFRETAELLAGGAQKLIDHPRQLLPLLES